MAKIKKELTVVKKLKTETYKSDLEINHNNNKIYDYEKQ